MFTFMQARTTGFFLISFFIIAGLFSCTPQKKLVYLQGDASLLNDTTTFSMPVLPGDILLIQLVTVNPEAFPALGVTGGSNDGNDTRSAYEKGIVVDPSGNLSLPYVGTISTRGMYLHVLHDTIVERFRKFIDDPVVIVKKISFKVSVLGEVNRPGLYYVPNEQLTLAEALSLAGDLNNYADRTALRIIRKTDKGMIELPVDITNKSSMTGNTRYIFPDDIIYAPPTRKKAFTAISPATAVLTSMLTAFALIATAYFRSK